MKTCGNCKWWSSVQRVHREEALVIRAITIDSEAKESKLGLCGYYPPVRDPVYTSFNVRGCSLLEEKKETK